MALYETHWESGTVWIRGIRWGPYRSKWAGGVDIAQAFRDTRQGYFLITLDFNGWIQRFTTKLKGEINSLAVPNSDGDDLFFDGLIQNNLEVGSSLDLYSMRQTLGNVRVDLINKNRFQDNEKHHQLDGGIGEVHLWTPGLDWTDIEEKPIFRGVFRKEYHNKFVYSFTLEDTSKSKFKKLPQNIIDTDTWPSHRTEGGGGSVAGKPEALIFGDWPKGIPILCVYIDSASPATSFVYLASIGKVKSTDADYTATTENVYDKDGSVVAAAGYTFYPDKIDGEGNITAYFDFTGDQADNEPLSCSICGLTDGSGEYTGTAGTLLEHPADICHYLLTLYTNFDLDEISIETIRTMRSLLPGYKFASIINKSVEGVNLFDRLLLQCQCARVQRWGKTGILTLDMDDPLSTGYIHKFDLIGRTVKISKTPYEQLCNNLRVFYGLNPTTGKWEGEFVIDRTNDPECEKSYWIYGEQPQQELQLTDVQLEWVARACANRWLQFRRFRHDVVECSLPYGEGWDCLEGDGGLLTIEEGASLDGEGWVDEPCLLLSRKFSEGLIKQTWWRIDWK